MFVVFNLPLRGFPRALNVFLPIITGNPEVVFLNPTGIDRPDANSLWVWASVVLAAFACSMEIGFSGTIGLKAVSSSMLKVHALIGIAEAVITLLLIKMFSKGEVK